MKIKQVSASQISSFNDCARKWYHRYVDKVRFPSTPAQLRGTGIHKSIEHYLLTGEILDNEWKKFVEAAIPYLPAPGGPIRFFVEHKFLMPTFDGGPRIIGFIDLLIDMDDGPAVALRDFKTTSDFRYCKTPKEMEEDIQLNKYAKYLMREQERLNLPPSPIPTGLLYLHTKRVKVQTRLVETELTQWQVDEIWERDMRRVRQMMSVAEISCVDDVPPTTASCGKYGGCEYAGLCGLPTRVNPGVRSKRSSEDMGSFLDKIKKSRNNNSKPEGAPVADAKPPEVVAKPADGVVPEDAASPVTEVVAETAPPVDPPKKGRKKMTDAQKAFNKVEKMKKKMEEAEAEAKAIADAEATADVVAEEVAEAEEAPEPEPAPAPVAAATNTTGFALFIDCLPIKGVKDQMVLFDDWIAGIIADINENIDVADYRLLKFQEEKMALQAGIEKHIDTVPAVLIVRDSGVGKDALTTLIPHARKVTRAMR